MLIMVIELFLVPGKRSNCHTRSMVIAEIHIQLIERDGENAFSQKYTIMHMFFLPFAPLLPGADALPFVGK